MGKNQLEQYWTERYHEHKTGWDIGYISTPLKAYFDQLTNKNLKILIPGAEKQLLQEDFFEHTDTYDLIIEQTFFCSFPPLQETRNSYAKQMVSLLNTNGKLVGLWFDFPLTGDMEKRPFGGDKELYVSYLEPHFTVKIFERCYNSIPERQGNELFGVFMKKSSKHR